MSAKNSGVVSATLTNLNFFCAETVNADNTKNPPIHSACSGKTVIDFGLETELIVACDCPCHWVTINPSGKSVKDFPP